MIEVKNKQEDSEDVNTIEQVMIVVSEEKEEEEEGGGGGELEVERDGLGVRVPCPLSIRATSDMNRIELNSIYKKPKGGKKCIIFSVRQLE
jgi:hypothetical protein